MSELKVDKITPRLGTTLTLGDAGDTINFGSGVLPNFENLTVTGDLTVDTNSLKVDSTNNYVGIGTASPDRPLKIISTSSSPIIEIQGSKGSGFEFGFGIDSNGGFLQQNGNTNLRAFVNGSERMRIASNGRVGIGTSSPERLLHLQSAAPEIMMKDSDDNSYNTILSNGGVLSFSTGSTEAMRIDSSGNVGIGTTSPSSYNSLADNLVVGANAGDNGITIASGTANGGRIIFSDNTVSPFRGAFEYDHSTDGMIFYTNGTEAMRILNNGALAIGNTNAGSALLSVQPNNAYLRMQAGSIDATNNVRLEAGGSTSNYLEYRGYLGHIWVNNTTERMRIDSSGNVLVGKTTIAGAFNTVGTELRANGLVQSTVDGSKCFDANRKTSDGDIIGFSKDGSAVGSIYNGGSNLGINSQGGLLLVDDIITPTSGADNTKDLGRSSARWKDLYLGGNIYLGGTGSANALDDYETGTFTITLTPSTSGSLTLSSTSDSCYYTKVGRTVFVQGRIVVDASSSPTGSALDVGGLPFTIQSPSEGAGYFGGMCAISFNGSNTFDAFPITAYSASGTTKITCSSVSSMNSNTRIHFNFFYYTAS